MIKNHDITQSEISEIIGIPIRTLKRNVANLKEKTIIERIGSDKVGYWVVNSRMIKK